MKIRARIMSGMEKQYQVCYKKVNNYSYSYERVIKTRKSPPTTPVLPRASI